MPFDIAALLVTSVALSGLTGAVVVSEAPHAVAQSQFMAQSQFVAQSQFAAQSQFMAQSQLAAESSAAVPGGQRDLSSELPRSLGQSLAPGLSLEPHVDAAHVAIPGAHSAPVDQAHLARLRGRALLDQLAALPIRDIAAFVEGNSQAVDSLLLSPPSATSVSRWWTLIPNDARESLLVAAPELVGNLDGVPMALRDNANREFLRASIGDAERAADDLGRAEKVAAAKRLHMLEEIAESLETTKGQPRRNLLSIDTAWPGRAAVVVGDLQSADYVTYLVPGMFFTVDGQMVDWTVISQDLYDEQVEWVDRLGGTDPALKDAKVATVSWIGYQTPGIMDVTSLDLAEDGAKFISSSVNGVQATRTGHEPYVTLLTHSYGSTATLMALSAKTMDVDALVIIGSPGSAAQSVDDLGMTGDKVFVGEAAWDPVVNTAFFGSDPGSDSFGASRMSVAGGDDPITGEHLTAASGHLGYFDAGSEAMRNMAMVGLDRGDLVINGADAPSGNILAGLW